MGGVPLRDDVLDGVDIVGGVPLLVRDNGLKLGGGGVTFSCGSCTNVDVTLGVEELRLVLVLGCEDPPCSVDDLDSSLLCW